MTQITLVTQSVPKFAVKTDENTSYNENPNKYK